MDFAGAATAEGRHAAAVWDEVVLVGWVDLVDLGWVKMEAGVAVQERGADISGRMVGHAMRSMARVQWVPHLRKRMVPTSCRCP